MRIRKLLSFWLVIAAVCLLPACRSAQSAVGTDSKPKGWHTLDVPLRVAVTSPDKLSANARLSMVRDSSVYLSLRMMGMEVAYLSASTDSVVLCSRFHKLYAADRLSRLLPPEYANMHTLQALLLGAEIPAELTPFVTAVNPAPAGSMLPAQSVDVTVEAGRKPLKAQLLYENDQLQIDGPAKALPKLPRNAQRLDTDNLLKALFQF